MSSHSERCNREGKARAVSIAQLRHLLWARTASDVAASPWASPVSQTSLNLYLRYTLLNITKVFISITLGNPSGYPIDIESQGLNIARARPELCLSHSSDRHLTISDKTIICEGFPSPTSKVIYATLNKIDLFSLSINSTNIRLSILDISGS